MSYFNMDEKTLTYKINKINKWMNLYLIYEPTFNKNWINELNNDIIHKYYYWNDIKNYAKHTFY